MLVHIKFKLWKQHDSSALQENEIPEETLPHPFGHTNHNMTTESSESIPSILAVPSTAASPVEKLSILSHFTRSFNWWFSQRSPCSVEMKSPLLFLSGKVPMKMDHQKMEEDSTTLITPYISPSKGIISSESTLVKEISTPIRLMSTTPELQMPKRSRKGKNADTPQKEAVKRGARTRLFPTPRNKVKFDGAVNFSEHSPVEDDVLGFLPESLLQNIE